VDDGEVVARDSDDKHKNSASSGNAFVVVAMILRICIVPPRFVAATKLCVCHATVWKYDY
jgi:hypothetical protein